MAICQPRYPNEDFAQRGAEAYWRFVEPELHPDDAGKTIAIDIETGDWELDEDEIAACDRLLARRPDAQLWLTRAGGGPVRHFGKGRRSARS